LLPQLNHPDGRHAEHLVNPGYLVVLGAAWKQRES
jgi:hypothetical protein